MEKPKISVLCVDDDPSLLHLARLFLEKIGNFTVDTAESAEIALEKMDYTSYDAIVSDYMMPKMDGIELLKKIRGSGNQIPFIIFTGKGREEVVIQAFESGADFYIQKGGDPKSQFVELERKVIRAVELYRADHEHRETEQRLTEIVNFLPDATFAIDTDGRIIVWNRAAEEMTGVLASDMLGKGNYEYAIPIYGTRRPVLIDLIFESEDTIARYYTRIGRRHDTLIAETSFTRPGGKVTTLLCDAGPLYNLEGEIVGSIESFRDITEMKRTEDELRAAYGQLAASDAEIKAQFNTLAEKEQRYRLLLENANDAVFVHELEADGPGRCLEVNRRACELTGYTREELLHGGPQDLDTEEQRMRTPGFVGKVLASGHVTFQTDIVTKDGCKIPVEISATVFNLWGKQTGLSFVRDITERKCAEKALQESEERYRAVVEDQTELISRSLPDGTHVFVNEAYCRYFGLERDQILGKRFKPEVPEDDRWRLEQFLRSLSPAHPVDAIEHRIIMPDGSIRWQRWNMHAIYDRQGHLTGYQSVGLDVTKRKNDEEALRESRERLSLAIEGAHLGVVDVNLADRTLIYNREWLEMLGYPAGETKVPIEPWKDKLLHPDDLAVITSSLEDSISRKASTFESEFRLRHRNGTWRWIQMKGEIAETDNAGRPARIIGILQDTTDRKVQESILKAQLKLGLDLQAIHGMKETLQACLAAAIGISNMDSGGIYLVDPASGSIDLVVSINLGEEFIRNVSHYPPGSANEEIVMAGKPVYAKPGVSVPISSRFLKLENLRGFGLIPISSGGRVIACMNVASRHLDGVPASARIALETLATQIGMAIERIMSEECLSASEARYRTILENTGTALVVIEEDTTISFSNAEFWRLSGYSGEEIDGKKSWTEFVTQNDLERMRGLHRDRRMSREKTPGQYEFLFLARDGDVRNIFLTIAMMPGTNQSVASLIDITGRKRAEELFQTVFENTGTAMLILDEDTTILHVNREMEKITGYSRQEVEGRVKWPSMVHPDDEGKMLEHHRLRRIDPSRALEKYEFRFIHKDRGFRDAALTAALIPGTKKSVISIQDITIMKKSEKALKKANRQLALLGSFTRHDIFNKITVILAYLELARQESGDSTTSAYYREIEKATMAIRDHIEFTRVYSELGTKEPQWQELDMLLSRLPVPDDINMTTDARGIELLADPMIEKVFTNLLDNSVRHGGHARSIRVSFRESDDRPKIVWEDDGVGIPQEEKGQIFERGFGKNNGHGLFLVREMLAITGMTVIENGVSGRGARFEITLPEGSYRRTSGR